VKSGSADGFWFEASSAPSPTPAELLEELRRYQESAHRMRSRIRDHMEMGEKDLAATRHLLAARTEGRVLRQRELAALLEVREASASALVDRLVRHGFAERTPHPGDRRSTAVVPTALGEEQVRSTLGRTHERMHEVAASLTPEERAVVADFLRRMNHDVDNT
jgi:DNA-binding MarR family transcriptional regulator